MDNEEHSDFYIFLFFFATLGLIVSVPLTGTLPSKISEYADEISSSIVNPGYKIEENITYIEKSTIVNSDMVYLGYVKNIGYIFQNSEVYLFMPDGDVSILKQQNRYHWRYRFFPEYNTSVLVSVAGAVNIGEGDQPIPTLFGPAGEFKTSTDGSPYLSLFKGKKLTYCDFIEEQGYIFVYSSTGV